MRPGLGSSAMSRNVGEKSMFVTMSELTLPGAMIAGQRARKGMRATSSIMKRLS